MGWKKKDSSRLRRAGSMEMERLVIVLSRAASRDVFEMATFES